jgi:hypothetical protein
MRKVLELQKKPATPSPAIDAGGSSNSTTCSAASAGCTIKITDG